MSWKKHLYLPFFAVMTLSIVSCSSNVAQSQKNYNDKEKLGAKYKDRQYFPYTPYVQVTKFNSNKIPKNKYSFIRQLNNIYKYSPTLSSTYSDTYNKLRSWIRAGGNIKKLTNYGINIKKMTGEEGFQNVLMTGYYNPIINARRFKQGKYQHPIYAMPDYRRYTRKQIYNGALEGQGLELAYSDSMLDNFLLEVQGSGYINLGSGKLNYLAYAGQNGFKYTSIGRLLVEDGEIPKEKMSIQAIQRWSEQNPDKLQSLLERNPSYVFFKNDPSGEVKGSAGVPLIALASVASDTNVVPSGTPLLIEMPLIDTKGNWTGKHELRLMIALDVGGAIKGHHFDIYQGIGKKAGKKAGLMKHYGRAWLLQ